MGRRKIQIAPIVDDRNRNVTFGKRRNGLFKKAFELGVLCQVDVAVLVWSHTGKLHCYSSQGMMHKLIDRYQNQTVDDTEITGPNAYGQSEGGAAQANGQQTSANPVKLSTTKSGNKKRRRSSDDSDEDEDDDGEEDAEDAAMPVKSDKPRSENKTNGNQLNGQAELARQTPPDAFAAQQMSPNNPYGAPYFSGYPNIPGYGQYNPQQQALANQFGMYSNMSAEAQQRAQAAAFQQAAAYNYASSFLMNNNNGNNDGQGKYPAAYTPIQSPPPMQESAPTHMQGPNYGGGNGRDRMHQPQRQESMNSEHGSTTSRPELHLSVPGLGGGSALTPNESALRLDVGGNGRAELNGQNNHGKPEEGRRSMFTASDSLLHLSENFGPSPSSLFPEIYRSMNHFGDSQAFQAAMSMNSAEEAAAGVFKWPTINNSNNNNNSSFSNNSTPAATKVEETSMRSTQGNDGSGTPQITEQNRRSPSHPQGEST